MEGSKTRVAAVVVATLVMTAGAGWYLASPVWMLHEIEARADANDPEALNCFVAYPALRESLKTEIKDRITVERKGTNPFLVVSVSRSEKRWLAPR